MNARLPRNLEEPFEQRPTNILPAEVGLHIETLDLDIRLQRGKDLHGSVALHGAVNIAELSTNKPAGTSARRACWTVPTYARSVSRRTPTSRYRCATADHR